MDFVTILQNNSLRFGPITTQLHSLWIYMNLTAFWFYMCSVSCETSVTFEHLEHLKSRTTRVLVPQIMTCRQYNETWRLVVMAGNLNKKKSPKHFLFDLGSQSIVSHKIFFFQYHFPWSSQGWELLHCGGGIWSWSWFMPIKSKMSKTSATGELCWRGSGWGTASLLTLQSLILKQVWTLHIFLLIT